ncbi:alpha/beta hydrolase family protein [Paenibacillus tarimensis]|uniref:alpha/beta hydrolase family protein n=1 Tax=Paenibacillus tarimensis TaxID=416012 RepID=UPI001F332766|nr:alpha/beta fold hydrolase [Paenibacillus tarimensis]MCF2944821.1 alpha/beta fold hydrolase [Paenibacillus tarimensis]
MDRLKSERFRLELGEGLYLKGTVTAGNAAPGAGSPQGRRGMPVLLLCHGFKGFAEWGFIPYTAEWFAQKGFYTVRFDFSCNGVGETDFDELDKFAANTYSREQADLEALLSAVRRRQLPLMDGVDETSISLLGHSRGGGNAILFGADHSDICAVVTWNGIANANLFDEEFEAEARKNGRAFVMNARTKQEMPIGAGFFDDLHSNRERFSIPKRLADLRLPVLLIQGDADSDRLVEGHALMKSAASQHQYVTITGAGHTFGAVHPFTGPTAELTEALNSTFNFLSRIHSF